MAIGLSDNSVLLMFCGFNILSRDRCREYAVLTWRLRAAPAQESGVLGPEPSFGKPGAHEQITVYRPKQGSPF